VKILNVEGNNEEVGRIAINVKYRSTTFEDKISDDIHAVE